MPKVVGESRGPLAAWLTSRSRDYMLGWGETASTSQLPKPLLPLSGPMKTALASLAGATIALPSSLPFALFALDFGKEGAAGASPARRTRRRSQPCRAPHPHLLRIASARAVLSGLLSVIGSFSALFFLRSFPSILRKSGWFGVHAVLASLGAVASLAMGAIMFSDMRKFARGYETAHARHGHRRRLSTAAVPLPSRHSP